MQCEQQDNKKMNRQTLNTFANGCPLRWRAFLVSRRILCTFLCFSSHLLVCGVHPIHNLAHCYLYYILCGCAVCARCSIFIVECHCSHLFSRSIIGWFYNDIFYTLVMYALQPAQICLGLPCLSRLHILAAPFTCCCDVFLSGNSIEMIYCCV